MALVTLTYNSSTGSDTAASGSGPATAVTGSTATNGTGNVINLDGSPDLSGVLGNAVFWGNTASGNRKLSRVTSVDDTSKTVTTEDLLTLGAGKSWAIGGKRQTLTADTTNQDPKDATAGWRFELEGSGTYTFAGAGITLPDVGDTANGGVEIVAAAGASPTIAWTGNNHLFATVGGHFRVEGIAFSNTTSTSSLARVVRFAAGVSHFEAVDCSMVCSGSCVFAASTLEARLVSCDLESTYSNGVELQKEGGVLLIDCEIHECGAVGASAGTGDGVLLSPSNSYATLTLIGTRIWGSYANGVRVDSDSADCTLFALKNTIDDNGEDGFWFGGTLSVTNRATLLMNSITQNLYGVNVNSAAGGDWTILTDWNGYWSNTSGETNNVTKGAGSVSALVDPYVDSAARDYRLNATATGGPYFRQAGLVDMTP